MHRSTEPPFDLEGVSRPLSERGRVAPAPGRASPGPSSAPATIAQGRVGAVATDVVTRPPASARQRRRRRLGVAVGVAFGAVACASVGIALARRPRRRRWARAFA